jgi:diaminopimelate epimerase
MTPISMDQVAFVKMSASGNDFILIDHRLGGLDASILNDFVVGICRRRLSVGADGVILVEPSSTADFSWRFFNADGSGADMCGNGARCAARFAHRQGICGRDLRFETGAGLVAAQVNGVQVKVRMPDPHSLEREMTIAVSGTVLTVNRINTGVPHVVVLASAIDDVELPALGREIRYHPQFAPDGTNVNFICLDPRSGGIAIRTYERGVEGETLSCGTGAVAGALIAAEQFGLPSPVSVRTRSGETLSVSFQSHDGRFRDVFQEGEARFIYSGALSPEAWR